MSASQERSTDEPFKPPGDFLSVKYDPKRRTEANYLGVSKLGNNQAEQSIEEVMELAKLIEQQYRAATPGSGEEDRINQILFLNQNLVGVVDKLLKVLHNFEEESNEKLKSVTHRMESLVKENKKLLSANQALKERVSNDVLQKRLANRIEVAAEKVRNAAVARSASLQRLQWMEMSLMESHDDLYHRQRFDAADLPQRDVSFVFHYISNLTFPLKGAEEMITNLCNQLLLTCNRKRGGHLLSTFRGMQVFVFQDPFAALSFAQDSHLLTLQFRYHDHEDLPHFSAVYDHGHLIFRGPRLHTCIYACTPEIEVDPTHGHSAYFGPSVREAVKAALQFSAVGEVVVNKKWVELICRRQRFINDSNAPVQADAGELANCIGKEWDVAEMPGAGGIICSLVPMKLLKRRSKQAAELAPTPRYPCMDLDLQEGLAGIVRALKTTGERSVKRRHVWATEAISLEDADYGDGGDGSVPMKLLQYFTMKQERDDVAKLYNDLQRIVQYYERGSMMKEDRYEISNRSPLDPSETVYVCTVDFGNDAFWKSVVVSTMTNEEYNSLRQSIRSYIHQRSKTYYGFLMNGNDVDIFTYVFRDVAFAFSFVSDVYIMVNRLGTKCSHATQGSGQDVFFLRAGVTSGPMSSIYRIESSSRDSVKCTGAMIRLSGALTDLSQNGEILATDDVIENFLSKNENLLDAQYNIVRQGGQYVGGNATPSAVHSILPKPFAYRRQKLLQGVKLGRQPSRSAASALEAQRTEYSKIMVEDLMLQQRERLESVEAALMKEQDSPSSYPREMRNPWFIVMQATPPIVPFGSPPSVKPTPKPLGFFLCDITGAVELSKSLGKESMDIVYNQYNHIVQSTILKHGGFIAKTNGTAAYFVVFPTLVQTMEAALWLQQQLLGSPWPEKMKCVSSSLFVKDVKTGAVIFQGPRVKTVVHISNSYTWKRISVGSGPSTGIDFTGAAIDEVYYLAQNTRGGEIRFSRQCVDALKRSSSGKLLLTQLEMEMLAPIAYVNSLSSSFGSPLGTRSSPKGSIKMKESAGTIEVFTAVPRSIAGRLPFLLPAVHGESEGSPTRETVEVLQPLKTSSTLTPSPIAQKDRRQSLAPVVPLPVNSSSWLLLSETSLKDLPEAQRYEAAALDSSKSDVEAVGTPETRDLQLFAEKLLSKFPVESSGSLDSHTVKSWPAMKTKSLNFLRFSREVVSHLVQAFRIVNDNMKTPSLPKISILKRKPATLPPLGTRGRIPRAPAETTQKPHKGERDNFVNALEYLDDSCKLLSKLNALEES